MVDGDWGLRTLASALFNQVRCARFDAGAILSFIAPVERHIMAIPLATPVRGEALMEPNHALYPACKIR